MKKIAISFFAAIFCIFLAAMETQPNDQSYDFQEQSNYLFYSQPQYYQSSNHEQQSSYLSGSQPQYYQSYTPEEQSGYFNYSQQYNSISYDPYSQSNTSPPTYYALNTTEVYAQPGITQENEPLMRKFVSSDSVAELNQEIYKKAGDLIQYYMRRPARDILSDIRLIELLTRMKDVKSWGLFNNNIGKQGIKESPRTTLFLN